MNEDDKDGERTDGEPEDEEVEAEQPAQSPQADPVDPKEAFVQGMGLLFHAARGALGGLRKEIEKADIPSGLRSAAEEMKRAADAAIQGKPREPEPEWVQEKSGARIETDQEPAAEPKDESPASDPEPKAGEGGD